MKFDRTLTAICPINRNCDDRLFRSSSIFHQFLPRPYSEIGFDQAVYSVRAGGRVVAVGLPSEMMDIPIIKTVIDGIEVVGSIVGTRKDLEEAFDFGARGVVVPVVQTRPIEDAIKIFEEMENGTIQGRMVIDMDYHNKNR